MTKDYSKSKFGGAVSEKLYDMSLEGMCDEEIGSVDDIGWHGIFRFHADEGRSIHTALKGAVGAILREDSQGFVTSEVFTNKDDFLAEVSDIYNSDRSYGDELDSGFEQ